MLSTYPNSAHNWPWWLREGLATAFEVAPVNGKPTIYNPWRLPMIKYLHKTGQGMSLKHLLSFNGQAVRQETYAKDYARAWALTCYLTNNQPQLLKDCMAGKHVLHSKYLKEDPIAWLDEMSPFKP